MFRAVFLPSLLGSWLLFMGCTDPGPDSVPSTFEPFPAIREILDMDLADIDPCHRSKLEEARKRLEAALASSDLPAGRLAAAYGETGMWFLALGRFKPAVTLFERAAQSEPDDFRWHYYLGRMLKAELALSRAFASFEAAVEHNRQYVPALFELGEAHRGLGRIEEAESLFRKALAEDPDCVAAMVRLAQIANLRKAHGEAVSLVEQALALQPNAAPAHYTAALSYRDMGNLEKAEHHFRERDRNGVALELEDPLIEAAHALTSDPEANFSCGERALAEENLSDAIQYFQVSVSERPEDFRYRNRLAWALIRAGRKPEALTEYRALAELRPMDPNPRFNLGGLLLELGLPAEAAEVFAELARLIPNRGEPHFYRAEALRFAGSYQAALKAYGEAIERDAEHAGARVGRVLMLARLDEYETAVGVLAQDLEDFPGDAALSHILARIFASCPRRACRDGEKAAKLVKSLHADPLALNLQETRAMVLAENGNYEEASQWQQRAIAQARDGRTPEQLAEMIKQLEAYRSGKPCRLPWPEGDPVFLSKSYRIP